MLLRLECTPARDPEPDVSMMKSVVAGPIWPVGVLRSHLHKLGPELYDKLLIDLCAPPGGYDTLGALNSGLVAHVVAVSGDAP